MTDLDLNSMSVTQLASLARILDEQEKACEDGKLDLYEPHEGQVGFHKSPAKVRLAVTGNRFGKTTASVIEAVWLALGIHPYHPITTPNRGKLYGVSFKQVDDTIRAKFEEWVPRKFLSKKKPYTYNQHGHLTGVNFWNGSTIQIGTYDQGKMTAEGSNWHYVAFDEPPPRELYVANLRGLVDFGGIMWFTMTPLHEAWIFDELWSPGLEGTKDYIDCFTGSSYDNPYSDKASLKLFDEEMTDTEREIRIEGKFARLQGLVIDTYRPDLSDVDPFKLTSDYVLYEGIDPHPGKANRALWKAIDPEGRRYVVRELLCDEGTYVFGREIARIRKELQANGAILCQSVSDTSLNQKDMHFKINQRDELCRALRDNGERLMPSNAQKRDWLEAGITKLRDLYRPVQQIMKGEEIKAPTEFVFKSCTSYKYELTHYQWPQRDMLENTKPVAKDNDLIDCNRYIESVAPEFRTPGDTGIVRNYTGSYQRLPSPYSRANPMDRFKDFHTSTPGVVRYQTRNSTLGSRRSQRA